MQQYSGLGGVAYRGEDHIRSVFLANAIALPTGVDTIIAAHPHWGFGSLDTTDHPNSFHVGGDGLYNYEFFIPVLSGATGGNITITLNLNGSPFESWTKTIPANSRDMLTGMNIDDILQTDWLTILATHSSGSGWSIPADGFFMTEFLLPL